MSDIPPHALNVWIGPVGDTGFEIDGAVTVRRKFIETRSNDVEAIRVGLEKVRSELAERLRCQPSDINLIVADRAFGSAKDVPDDYLTL